MIIGQEKAKAQIDILIHHEEKKPILLVGPSGYGKTSLAYYIARNKHIESINCSFLRNEGEFVRKLIATPPNSFLFLDEIHALNSNQQEMLYTIIDDRILYHEGRKIVCNSFQIIGATTKDGSLNEPLYNRFVFKIRLDKYTIQELAQIVYHYLADKGISCNILTCEGIASISRNNPRVAKSRVEWVTAFCKKQNKYSFCESNLNELRAALDINEDGLEKIDRDYLEILRKARKPVSLKSISQILRTDQETVENTIESFLLDKNLIGRGPRGRYLIE